MKYVEGYECTLCHKIYDKESTFLTCPTCGEKGILDVLYDYEAMKQEVTRDYFKQNDINTMLRYTPMMSIKETNLNTLKVGCTPLYKGENLGKKLSLNKLYIKDEGVNPTASLKDRASLVACLKAIEEKKEIICCSSTGNAASSLAGNATKLGLKSLIFVPKRAPLGKIAQLVTYGAHLIKIDGDYKQTFTASKEAINAFQLYNRNAAINPHLVEGKKTVALEIAEQLDFAPIDNVIVSVGDGCTIAGVYKGFYDLVKLDLIDHIPNIYGVQASGCKPFYDAWKNNETLMESEERTIADSIAVGIPRNPVKALQAVTKSNGEFVVVTDNEIINAIHILGNTEGIFSEPAAAASTAGLMKLVKENKIKTNEVTVVINTGNGLKDLQSVMNSMNEVFQVTEEEFKQTVLQEYSKQDIQQFLQKIKSNEVKKHE